MRSRRGSRVWGALLALGVAACGGSSADPDLGLEGPPGAVQGNATARQNEALQSTGATRLVLQAGGPGFQEGSAIAFDADNNFVVLGYFIGSIGFPDGSSFQAPGPELNLIIVKYHHTGRILWVRTFGAIPGSSDPLRSRSLAVDRWGNVVFAAFSSSPVDFGGGRLSPGGFLVKLNPNGDYVWSRELHVDDGLLQDARVETDRDGNIIFAGTLIGTLDFGSGQRTSAGGGREPSAVLAKFSANNPLIWVNVDPRPSRAAGLAVEDDGDLIQCTQGAEGPGSLSGATVTKLNRHGRQIWSRTFEASGGYLLLLQVAVQGNTVVAVGALLGSAHIAGRQLKADLPKGLFIGLTAGDGRDLWARALGRLALSVAMADNCCRSRESAEI